MIKCKILKTNPPADRKDLFYIIFVTLYLCGCAVTQQNKLLRRGIEREFEIIGEAMNGILKEDKTIQIESTKKIIGLRNWIIHGYNKVDDAIIWGIIVKHLPKLKIEIYNLLDNENDKR